MSRYLIRKEVMTMTKGDKEIKKQTEEKKVEIKIGGKSCCDCGCVPPPLKSK
jgi:hypothetical protein